MALPLGGRTAGLAVPSAAIVRDIYGGEWVYRKTAPHTYVRQRIEVARVANGRALLSLALAVLLVVLGIRATGDLPLDVFPEFASPMVEIQTEAPGLSTEEVESLTTVPIETAVNGVPDLMTLRSKSGLGFFVSVDPV